MLERFADVVMAERSCSMDGEYREARESVSTKVDVVHLKTLMGIVLKEWWKICMP